jgi:hypothetical protein
MGTYRCSDVKVKKGNKDITCDVTITNNPLNEFICIFRIKIFFLSNFISTYPFTVHYHLNDQVLTLIKKEEGYIWSGNASVLQFVVLHNTFTYNVLQVVQLKISQQCILPSAYTLADSFIAECEERCCAA